MLEGLQDPAAAGLLVEQVEKEVQEEQEVKVGLVVLLVSVMLSRESGQQTRTGMSPMIAIICIVDVIKIPAMTPVLTLLLAPLVIAFPFLSLSVGHVPSHLCIPVGHFPSHFCVPVGHVPF